MEFLDLNLTKDSSLLHLWLIGPDPNPDPTPDPTPFFSNLGDGKKFVFIFFLITYLNTFMRKVKDPEPDQYPYLRLMDRDPDPDPQHWYLDWKFHWKRGMFEFQKMVRTHRKILLSLAEGMR
jgi:hypothetical protein